VSVTICFANCIGATVGTLKGTCQAQKSFASASSRPFQGPTYR
jgi:hypothetical protein